MNTSGEPNDRRAALTLAVVVPTLNEEAMLPALLASLHAQTHPAERIVVADGGSHDRTASEARLGGAEVVVAPGRGRGGQIAAGAAELSEDVVLVAHADMRFPPLALETVRKSLAQFPRCPGGSLGHRFDDSSPSLRLIEWWDRRRARRGASYGDQAQFYRRNLLDSLGGFPNQPIMEDVELSLRLRRLGTPIYLDLPVTVSARRFVRKKWWRIVWQNFLMRRSYRRHGLPVCAQLHERYYRDS